MSATKEIRNHYGLSQQQLAAYLNISQSYLALVETNRRSLPTAALIKLGHLEIHRIALVEAQNVAMPSMALASDENFAQLIAEKIKLLQYRAETLRRALALLQTQHSQAVLQQSLIDMPEAKKFTGRDADWLLEVHTAATEIIPTNHPGLQALLHIEIEGLQHQEKALLALL